MNPLQELKDIHAPAAVEFWPPAYGWWLLVGLLLVSIVLFVNWALKFRRARLAKRQALHSLKRISDTGTNKLSELNQLLKRAALSYFQEQNPQALHGKQWSSFLLATLPAQKAKGVAANLTAMQAALYQADSTQNDDFAQYAQSAEIWLKYALPPKKSTLSKLEQQDA